MGNPMTSNDFLQYFRRWAEDQPLVRAALLTSTRTVPGATVDVFSDYDIILALQDVRPFHESRDWLAAFGTVLVMYRDPLEQEDGVFKSGNVIQFKGGLKIDFILWSVEILQRISAQEILPEELDAGYLVLLDKDHLTHGLKPPTYQAYIPSLPSENRFRDTIEWFFVDATYVAKFLWRDDLMAAKHIFEAMRQEYLLPMFEWHSEIGQNWSLKTGPYGRGLKKHLRSDLWAGLEGTYCGPNLDENWDTLFKTITLMHQVAQEVADRLGFTYPYEMERFTLEHLNKVRLLDQRADHFI